MENEHKKVKDQILESATRFFYDIGYEDTTIGLIANDCNISKGLVNYHFNSKAEIAMDVYDAIRTDFRNVLTEKIIKTGLPVPLDTMPAIYDRVSSRFLYADAQYAAFFKSFWENTCTKDLGPFNNGIFMYNTYCKTYADDPEELKILIPIASRAAGAATTIAFLDSVNRDCISYEAFEDFRVLIKMQLMNYPKDSCERILKESKAVADKIEMEFLPYFKCK